MRIAVYQVFRPFETNLKPRISSHPDPPPRRGGCIIIARAARSVCRHRVAPSAVYSGPSWCFKQHTKSCSFYDTIHVCRGRSMCSLPKDSTACTTKTTVAACQSFGIDCTETCVHAKSTDHRRAQGGAAAAMQVQAGESSGAKLTKMLDCLAESQDAATVATCTAKA